MLNEEEEMDEQMEENLEDEAPVVLQVHHEEIPNEVKVKSQNEARCQRLKNRTATHTWCKKDGSTIVPEFQTISDMEPCSLVLQSPYLYFKSFITDEFLDLILKQSNLYAIQKNVNKLLNVTRNEMEQWLSLVIYFS